MNDYGFIYKDNGDYAIRMGQSLYFLYDGISDISEEVEIGNIRESNLVEGYCLRVNKLEKKWNIVDTGHKNCKDIIASGNYNNGFIKSLEPITKVFK